MPSMEVAATLARHFTAWVKEQKPLRQESFAKLGEARPHILAVLAACRNHQQWQPAGNLAIVVDDYLELGGYWSERVTALQIALLAAQALQNRGNEGACLGRLGTAYHDLGQYQQAIRHFEQALAIARETGDRRGEGTWLGNLGAEYGSLGQHQQTISYYEQGLAMARDIGDRDGEGAWLIGLGTVITGSAR